MTRHSCEKKISRIETSLRGLRDNENEGREQFVRYFTKLIKHLFRKHDRPEVERLLSKKNPNLESNITFFVEELAKNVFDRKCNKQHSTRFRTYQKDIVKKLIKAIRISSDQGRLELEKSLEGAAHNQYDVYKKFTQDRWENIIQSVKTNDIIEKNKDSVFTGEEAQLMIDRMIDVQLLLIGCDDEKTQTILRSILVSIIKNSDLKAKLTVEQKKQFYELRRTCQQGGETYHEPSIENLQTLLESIVYLFPNGGHNVTTNNINEIVNSVRGNTEQIQRIYDTMRGVIWNLVFTSQRKSAEKVNVFVSKVSSLWGGIINPTLVKLSKDVNRKPESSELDYLNQILELVQRARAVILDVAKKQCEDKGWGGAIADNLNIKGFGLTSSWNSNRCDSLADDAVRLEQIVESIKRHVALTTYDEVKRAVEVMAKENLFAEIDKIFREDTEGKYSKLKGIFDDKRASMSRSML